MKNTIALMLILLSGCGEKKLEAVLEFCDQQLSVECVEDALNVTRAPAVLDAEAIIVESFEE